MVRHSLWLLAIFYFSYSAEAQYTRGDTTQRKIALVFTGDEFGDGASFIRKTLKRRNVPASFFLTGNFYRNPAFSKVVTQLVADGHYMGSHSDKHLLYCDWENRDSLLVTKEEFKADLLHSYKELERVGVSKAEAKYFLPPYEWYNDSIVAWTKELGLTLVNFSPGTRSTADYTYPGMGDRYVNSQAIFESIVRYEADSPTGLNGFILLVHIGTDPRRTDKFYRLLPELIETMRRNGYEWVRINEILKNEPGRKDSQR